MATMLIHGETDLCLGLPGGGGRDGNNESAECLKISRKREFSETVDLKLNLQPNSDDDSSLNREKKMKASSSQHEPIKDPIMPPPKAQVVGWPPVKNYRKNKMGQKSSTEGSEEKSSNSSSAANLVKVCMDGAPYLRKVDLKMYRSYQHLSDALAKMFSSFSTIGKNGMIDFMNEKKQLMDLLNTSEYVPTYEDKDGDWMLVGDVPWEMFVESCNRLRIMRGSEAPRAMKMCKRRS